MFKEFIDKSHQIVRNINLLVQSNRELFHQIHITSVMENKDNPIENYYYIYFKDFSFNYAIINTKVARCRGYEICDKYNKEIVIDYIKKEFRIDYIKTTLTIFVHPKAKSPLKKKMIVYSTENRISTNHYSTLKRILKKLEEVEMNLLRYKLKNV